MKLVFALLVVAACGGPAAAPSNPEPTVEAVADLDWDAGAGAVEPAAAASDASTSISCVSMNICTEMKVTPKEAAESRERCVGASGESHDGPCSHAAVLATCTLPKNQATIFYYRDDNADMERGRIKGGKPGCASAKGRFQIVAKGKTAK